MPALEVPTAATREIAEYEFVRARIADRIYLPTRRRTVLSVEAILDEEASLHAERNVLAHEQHVAIQHPMDTNSSTSQRHIGIYLIHPPAVQNALVPFAIVIRKWHHPMR